MRFIWCFHKKNFGCIFPGLQQILSDKCLKLPPVFPNCSIYAELSKIIINDVILLFYSHHRPLFYRIYFTEEIPLKEDQSRGFNSSMKLLHMYAMHTHTQWCLLQGLRQHWSITSVCWGGGSNQNCWCWNEHGGRGGGLLSCAEIYSFKS